MANCTSDPASVHTDVHVFGNEGDDVGVERDCDSVQIPGQR